MNFNNVNFNNVDFNIHKIFNFVRSNKYILLIIFFIIYFIYSIYMKPKALKVVVFDLDETLGHFSELGAFCETLEKYNNKKLTRREFDEILDLFPEFFRPNIIKILLFLKTMKERNILKKVFIYTNNNGPKEWSEKIKRHLENKINYKLFDKIIGAYKINGEHVELGRTTYNKTVTDFLSITKLPNTTEICFLDDVYHKEMNKDNVYYLKIKPYVRLIPFYNMAERYYNKNIIKSNKKHFINFVVSNMNKYNKNVNCKTNDDIEDEINISREILNYLKDFLDIKIKKNKTLRQKTSKRKTNKI